MSVKSRASGIAAKMTTHPRIQPLLRRVMPPADRALARLTRGRFHFSDPILPTLILHHTGRRSGQMRATPLAHVVDGDQYLVVGSNWGQTQHPAWALNISDVPDVEVEVKGRRIPAVAHRLEGDEREAAWAKMRALWPSFDTYEVTAGDREIRVFALRPA
ncbi:MAG: nitroreductase family deazaflavin-dependent oxidoreductase [Microthrixaceae bacterium]